MSKVAEFPNSQRAINAERGAVMRRWLIAVAALLGLTVSASHADYVIIRVYSKSNNNLGGPMGVLGIGGAPPMGEGVGGSPMGFQGSGFRGVMGAGGQPPIGAIGFGGQPPVGPTGFQGRFGNSGAGGQPPLGPPMGAMGRFGNTGGPPGPMGAMGFQGRFGNTGGPPGPMGAMGFQGRFGNTGGPPGPMGAMGAGGQPPMGVLGFGGQPPIGALGMGGQPPLGMMGEPGNNLGGQPPSITHNDYVTVVVEVKKTTAAPRGWRDLQIKPLTDKVSFMESQFGSTAIYDEDPSEIALQLIPSVQPKGQTGPALKSPSEQYTERRNAILRGKDRGPDKYFHEARWCLEVGLPDKCIGYLDELDKMVALAKDKNPLPKQVADGLAAYRKVKPIIEDEVAKKDKATAWKEKLGYRSIATHKHYALVHSSDDTQRDGIDRRLEALENNFKTFYLLFALKGKALPAPTQKLVAVLVAEAKTFAAHRQVFGVTDLVSDGFHARQENLAIFAPNRMDLASHTFGRTMQEVYREYQVDLLTGPAGLPDLGANKEQALRTVRQARRAQTLALVERALREESEIAAATHEGTLQLVAETGLLPRNAPAPEWLRFGLGSLFEMPKGPFPGRSESMVRLAFWPGAGGPNWSWRLYFDEMQQEGLIPDRPVELFYEALTDAWFERARDLERLKKEEDDVSEWKAAYLARGRTVSWALTYYLFKYRFDKFEIFLEELSKLPRDAELDHYTLVTTFLRTFGYDTAGLTPMDPKGKLDRYFDVARSWVAAIRNDPAPTVDLKLEEVTPVDPNNPNGPGGPGGIGPIGPGGPGPGIGGPGGGPGLPGGPGGPGRPPG